MAKGQLITAPTAAAATPGQVLENREKIMGSDLRAISDRWLETLRKRRTEDIATYWMMSQDILQVSVNAEKYGHDAAKTLLSRHSLDLSGVKDYLRVARNLTEEMVAEIIAYNNSPASTFGLITSSHLVLLAARPTDAERSKLWKAIKKQKLSVADVKLHIRSNADQGEEGVDDLAKKRVVAVLGKAEKSLGNTIDAISVVSSDTFAIGLKNVKEEDLTNAVNRCEANIAKLKELCEIGESILVVLENTREQLSHRKEQAAAAAAAKGRELKTRQTTNKRKLARAAMAAAADDVEVDEDEMDAVGVVAGVVSSKTVTPAVYKNPAKRKLAEAATKSQPVLAVKPAVAGTARPATASGKPRRQLPRRPVKKQ
jgi:hypothetical protein